MYTHRGFYIPAHMEESLRRYILHGEAPGSFLTAVLVNDLHQACAHADDENLRNLPAFMCYLYNEAPSPCWGSPKKFAEWICAFDNGAAPVSLLPSGPASGLPLEPDFGPPVL
jgi:hypothetical protein